MSSLTKLERELVDALLAARETLKAAEAVLPNLLKGSRRDDAREARGVLARIRAAIAVAAPAIQHAVGLVPDGGGA